MGLTPMMQQYLDLKETYKDSILFFRLGDFYEMFFEDAEIAARELELVLTGRDCGLSQRAPMCGIPYHASKNYIGRLVEKGYSVAICEQMEDPALAKGIVKRDVVKIITPGTLNDETFLAENKNNYLMAILGNDKEKVYSIAVTDITTGEYYTSTFNLDKEVLRGEMAKFSPREYLLFSEDKNGLYDFIKGESSVPISVKEGLIVEDDKLLLSHEFLQVEGSVPLNGKRVVLGLLAYLKETQKISLSNLTHLVAYEVSDTMVLDVNTRRNLELTENIVDKGRKGSLLSVLDKTMTSMGARNLRRWIEKPLIRRKDIERRLEAVDSLVNNIGILEALRDELKNVYDIERITGKIAQKTINARELLSLKSSLSKIPQIKKILSQSKYNELLRLNNDLDPLDDLVSLIDTAIDEDAPTQIKEGNLIKKGYSKEIDELRDTMSNGKKWILDLEKKEKDFTGINSLKIGYNKVFGYYIEITKANFSKIPQGRYIRKQTLSNAERFVTEELKAMEEKILGAEDKLSSLEYSLFVEVRDRVEGEIERLKKVALILSDLDCYQSFSKCALDLSYVKPTFNEEGRIAIKDGRHPVVENMIPRGEFVSNNTLLDLKANNFLIITGPNMSGKSTFMRQVALIVLMAQLGSFVPASFADIAIADRIFTRIGASDDLSGGKSTFMVEMYEVSNILKNATNKSLILLDEVGRGTSTYDGLSIAWAVTEHIMKDGGIKARTLFATHYHELIELEKEIPGIKNYSVAVKEIKGEVIFLRKIVEGGADESYGIEVARLAGLPKDVIDRSKKILRTLEARDSKDRKSLMEEMHQMSIMDYMNFSKKSNHEDLIDEIRNLDIDNLSPIEALIKLQEYKNKIRQKE